MPSHAVRDVTPESLRYISEHLRKRDQRMRIQWTSRLHIGKKCELNRMWEGVCSYIRVNRRGNDSRKSRTEMPTLDHVWSVGKN